MDSLPLETEVDAMGEDKVSIAFVITMDIVYKQLEKGVVSVEEYQKFLNEMAHKFNDENTRILYQSKLDIYRRKSD